MRAPSYADVSKLQGLYMCGGGEVGKTMLMDLLVRSAAYQFQVGPLA